MPIILHCTTDPAVDSMSALPSLALICPWKVLEQCRGETQDKAAHFVFDPGTVCLVLPVDQTGTTPVQGSAWLRDTELIG